MVSLRTDLKRTFLWDGFTLSSLFNLFNKGSFELKLHLPSVGASLYGVCNGGSLDAPKITPQAHLQLENGCIFTILFYEMYDSL